MTRLMHEATTATHAATANLPRRGRTYGHNRTNERTAERRSDR
ncbi:hypothetical protein FHS39_000198 [Streptomyces olivoverticillatus]|uniref:Uncharacterized protein n=1 Tax=Streptomyces olivoverticillatus TaxID=66427 RepID=A0A7W7PJA3_9ACTN|nr:hypothetical protein [Streptomyces olivoverticillatus]MBB4891198.1 hypothetical protein [Streptomyces olivoverticillatus]